MAEEVGPSGKHNWAPEDRLSLKALPGFHQFLHTYTGVLPDDVPSPIPVMSFPPHHWSFMYNFSTIFSPNS
jgi:hypothetical protein